MRKSLLMFFLLFLSTLFTGLKAQEYITDNPFETMIRLGSMNVKNPIYQMPSGQAGSAYIVSAITSGDAVRYPLGYTVASTPDRHFIIVSKATTLVEKERQFDLIIEENVSISGQFVTIYTDWDRDGVFVSQDQSSLSMRDKGFTASFQVPADAELGKARIRVRLDSSRPSGPDVAVSGGRVYDFVVYVMDKTDHDDCYISVSSSNDNLGKAVIETVANANGRYDKGSSVTVKAEPSSSAVNFEGWKVGQDIISRDQAYTFTVNESMHIIAVFSTVEPELSAPQTSTEANPIWFQIKNAHTATERANRYIAYDENPTGEYSSNLRAERPADISDKFLWRLESVSGNRVKIINKTSMKQIYSSGVLETQELTAEVNGSEFVIEPSGNANGSYSIKYEGNDGLLLNAKDGLWKIVLYNAGVGTGSGWYFYRVPFTSTGVENVSVTQVKAFLSDGIVRMKGLPEKCSVKVINLSGQVIGEFVPSDVNCEYKLRCPEEFVILMVKIEGQKPLSLKLYNRS